MKLLDLFPDVTGLALVFEYMPHTLYSKLKDEMTPLSRPTIRSYTSMLLHGVNYMHNLGIMHRVCIDFVWAEFFLFIQYLTFTFFSLQDIKPANLLIDDRDVLKIADFGLARIYSENVDKSYSPQVISKFKRRIVFNQLSLTSNNYNWNSFTKVASRWYRAPELLFGSSKYGPSVDMWAVGCVFAEMLRRIPLFSVIMITLWLTVLFLLFELVWCREIFFL